MKQVVSVFGNEMEAAGGYDSEISVEYANSVIKKC
jgi:hypothetical protein